MITLLILLFSFIFFYRVYSFNIDLKKENDHLKTHLGELEEELHQIKLINNLRK